jgi:alkylated DNA repair dioxygenase AlkB
MPDVTPLGLSFGTWKENAWKSDTRQGRAFILPPGSLVRFGGENRIAFKNDA